MSDCFGQVCLPWGALVNPALIFHAANVEDTTVDVDAGYVVLNLGHRRGGHDDALELELVSAEVPFDASADAGIEFAADIRFYRPGPEGVDVTTEGLDSSEGAVTVSRLAALLDESEDDLEGGLRALLREKGHGVQGIEHACFDFGRDRIREALGEGSTATGGERLASSKRFGLLKEGKALWERHDSGDKEATAVLAAYLDDKAPYFDVGAISAALAWHKSDDEDAAQCEI